MVVFDYNENATFNKIIDESPFHDDGGTKVFPITTTTLKFFYKSIYPESKDVICVNTLNELFGHLSSSGEVGFVTYLNDNEDNDDIDKLYKKVKSVFRIHGKVNFALCIKGDGAVLDIRSAIDNMIEYCRLNPMDKYAIAFTKLRSLNTFGHNCYVYDFLNHYDYNEIVNKENNAKSGYYNCTYSNQENKKIVETKKDVDKLIPLNDNMSLKEINDLCRYINDVIKFFEEQGIDWRKKIESLRSAKIDDVCGYPLVMSDEDIIGSIPFPEVVEGDEKLANM